MSFLDLRQQRAITFTITAILFTLVLAGCAAAAIANEDAEASALSGITVSGIVIDEDGPVEGASVRQQTTHNQVFTGGDGSFTIENIDVSQPITLVAWAQGYFFGFAEINGTEQESISITIKRHHRGDNLEYEWEPSENCGECHTANDEWKADAHSQTAVNHRFLNVYQATDVDGNRSPNTDYWLGFPKEHEQGTLYFGPGFKADFPERDGNCASCHTPMASNLSTTSTCGWSGCHMGVTADRSDELPQSVSPVGLSGVAAEGISCDFCHKIGRVRLEEETQLPKREHTGILALSIYRPAPGERFFVGSVDDVARDTDSYVPLHKESAFCAGCHYGVFSDTVVYNSYGEWLESPYNDEENGQTCQDCHMPHVGNSNAIAASIVEAAQMLSSQMGTDFPPLLSAIFTQEKQSYFVFPEKGGLYRTADQVHDHQMPGASDAAFLQNAVTMVTNAELVGGSINVNVQITNDKTGHHVPTGSPLRNMILIVEARDAAGNPLVQEDGPVTPAWAGNYASLAGKGYAKILQDRITDESPTIAHWRLTNLKEDTRIPAMATDESAYHFKATGEGPITVTAKLIYRRAFADLMEQKGWSDPDIVMEENSVSVVTN